VGARVRPVAAVQRYVVKSAQPRESDSGGRCPVRPPAPASPSTAPAPAPITATARAPATGLAWEALWAWKADGDAQTGFSDLHGPFGPGVAFPSRVRVTDRAYPVYLAGTLRGLSYDPNTAGVDLQADSPRVATGNRLHATLVYVPATATGSLTATGARWMS